MLSFIVLAIAANGNVDAGLQQFVFKEVTSRIFVCVMAPRYNFSEQHSGLLACFQLT